jgi:hypothetical protein
MRPRKTRFALREGKFLVDGDSVLVDPCLLAVCLVADGYPNLVNAVVSEETGTRILRLASAVSMVHQLEEDGLMLDGTRVYVDDEPGSPTRPPGSKDDLP